LTKVTIIRHGPKGQDGLLTEEGIQQTKDFGDRLRRKEGPFGLAISSPEKRASRTAEIVGTGCHIIIADEIGIPKGEDVLELFAKLGNAPLTEYLKGTPAKERLAEYGQKAWKKIKSSFGEEKHVLVVGHEVLIAAIGVAATQSACSSIARLITETTFKECDGFTITLENGKLSAIAFVRMANT